MSTLTLKVSEALNTELSSYSKKMGISKSEIVREAIVEYLTRDDVKIEGSFLDLAEDLAGSVDAPEDLSSNKKYLESYGK